MAAEEGIFFWRGGELVERREKREKKKREGRKEKEGQGGRGGRVREWGSGR